MKRTSYKPSKLEIAAVMEYMKGHPHTKIPHKRTGRVCEWYVRRFQYETGCPSGLRLVLLKYDGRPIPKCVLDIFRPYVPDFTDEDRRDEDFRKMEFDECSRWLGDNCGKIFPHRRFSKRDKLTIALLYKRMQWRCRRFTPEVFGIVGGIPVRIVRESLRLLDKTEIYGRNF